MPPNDTYGEITREQLEQLRAVARACLKCGMLATVDPAFHASRYGHAPVIQGDGGVFWWSGAGWGWEPQPDDTADEPVIQAERDVLMPLACGSCGSEAHPVTRKVQHFGWCQR